MMVFLKEALAKVKVSLVVLLQDRAQQLERNNKKLLERAVSFAWIVGLPSGSGKQT